MGTASTASVSGGNLVETLYVARGITEAEVGRLEALPEGRGETRAAAARDRMRCLVAAARGCASVGELLAKLARLFDTATGTMFSSVHKAKGLEADKVFILKPEWMPHPKAKQGWELEQEWNLWYVAVTRARRELWWVRGTAAEEEEDAE